MTTQPQAKTAQPRAKTARRGNAGAFACTHGLATKIQRQPFAPFQRVFRFNDPIAGAAPTHHAYSNLELAV
jgi:hypothetical protein